MSSSGKKKSKRLEEAKARLREKLHGVMAEKEAIEKYLLEMIELSVNRAQTLLDESDASRFFADFSGVNQQLENCINKLFLIRSSIEQDEESDEDEVTEEKAANTQPSCVAMEMENASRGAPHHVAVHHSVPNQSLSSENLSASLCKAVVSSTAVGPQGDATVVQNQSISGSEDSRQVALEKALRIQQDAALAHMQAQERRLLELRLATGGGDASVLVATKKTSASTLSLNSSQPSQVSLSEYGLGPSISSVELDEHEQVVLGVSYFANPNMFWAQKCTPDLPGLMEKICMHYANAGMRGGLKSVPNVGTVCCARWPQDKAWYRARVIADHAHVQPGVKVDVNKCFVTVQYIDYGNCCQLPITQLRLLEKEFAELPAQAVCCSMAGIQPRNNSPVWSPQDNENISKLLLGQPKLTYVAGKIKIEGAEPQHIVMMYISIDKKWYLVNEAVVKLGFADQLQRPTEQVPPHLPVDIASSEQKCKSTPEETPETVKLSSNSKENKEPSREKQNAGNTKTSSGDDETIPKTVVSSVCDLGKQCKQKESSPADAIKHLSPAVSSGCFIGSLTGSVSLTKDTKESTSVDLKPSQEKFVIEPTNSQDLAPSSKEKFDIQAPHVTISGDNCSIHCQMAHIVSPSKFFVHQVTEKTKQIDVVSEALKCLYEGRKPDPVFTSEVKVGDVCCSRYTQDGNWYRARVMALSQESGQCKVFYLDYGDEEYVPISALQRLTPELCRLPAFAIECSLFDLQPVWCVGTEPGEWSPLAVRKFVEYTGYDKVLTAFVVPNGKLSKSKALQVILVNVHAVSGELWVSEELVRLNLACPRSGAISNLKSKTNTEMDKTEEQDSTKNNSEQTPTVDAIKEWNPIAADFLSERNSYHVDIDSAEVAVTGYKHAHDKVVCSIYAREGYCRLGDRCARKHVRLANDASSAEEEEIICMDNHVIIPPVNTWVAVQVSSILAPDHFYVIMPYGSRSLDELQNHEELKQQLKYEDSLTKIMVDMKDCYSKIPYRDRQMVRLALGEIVVAKNMDDDQWSRARVIGRNDDENLVEVFYVDFGNTEWLREFRIRQLKPQFARFPFQAVECFLNGVQPVGGAEEGWTSMSRLLFDDMVAERILAARIAEKCANGAAIVDLSYADEMGEISVAAALVDNGVAQYKYKSVKREESKCTKTSSSQQIRFLPG